jgi:hypothetical protein
MNVSLSSWADGKASGIIQLQLVDLTYSGCCMRSVSYEYVVYPHQALQKLKSDKTCVGQAKFMPEIIVCSFAARALRLVNIYRLLFLTVQPNTFAKRVNIADTMWNCLLGLHYCCLSNASNVKHFVLKDSLCQGVLKRAIIYTKRRFQFQKFYIN